MRCAHIKFSAPHEPLHKKLSFAWMISSFFVQWNSYVPLISAGYLWCNNWLNKLEVHQEHLTLCCFFFSFTFYFLVFGGRGGCGELAPHKYCTLNNVGNILLPMMFTFHNIVWQRVCWCHPSSSNLSFCILPKR